MKTEDKAVLPASTKFALLSNIANAPSDTYSPDQAGSGTALVSIGNMGYGPNYGGVSWFLENVWPKFHEMYKNWKYKIVGGNASPNCKGKWSAIPGVEVMGFVDDLEQVYKEAYAVVAPINSGAGTCIKVIESAMYGKKTFATPFAARGMSADRKKDLGIDIFTTADEFMEKFAEWDKLGSVERNSRQVKFSEEARIAYSFDGFCKSVREMLVNG